MLIEKIGPYELRTEEAAIGKQEYGLRHGLVLWYKTQPIGDFKPANEVMAQFSFYPSMIDLTAIPLQDKDLFYRAITLGTDLLETCLQWNEDTRALQEKR